MTDYISRQAAIDAIAEHLAYGTYKNPNEFREVATLILKNLPSVEPKKGLWEQDIDHDSKKFGWYQCSECGVIVGLCTKFCPNCGADMRGEEEC